MRFLAAPACILLTALLAAGCSPSDPSRAPGPEGPADPATSPSLQAAPASPDSVIFDPRLLLSGSHATAHLAELPPVQVRLADSAPYLATVVVIVDCVDEATRAEIAAAGDRLGQTIVEAVGVRQFHEANSVVGKMRIRDDITLALRRSPLLRKAGGIRQVYFRDFLIEGRR